MFDLARSETTRFRTPDWAVAALVLVAASVLLWLQLPGFFRAANVSSEIRTALPTLCLAIGQMLIVSARGIDLSLGALLSLASSVMVCLFGAEPTWQVSLFAIAAGIAVAIAGGALNGLLVAYLQTQSVIATFATSFVFSGLALWVLPQPGGTVPLGLSGAIRAGPWAPLLVITAIGVVWLQFTRSSSYRKLLATGGEPNSATNTGINVAGVQFWTYLAAGLLTGIAALLLSADISSGDPLIGASMTLPTIVAVVIGGTRLTGGNATYVGTVAGTLLLIVIRAIVFAAGLPYEWQPLIDSVLILAILAASAILNVWRKS